MRACTLIAAVFLLTLPASASAGKIDAGYLESGPYLDYVADWGETNDVTVTPAPQGVRIHDAGAPIVSDPTWCKVVDAHTVTCEASDSPGIFLRDRDDRAEARFPRYGVALLGQAGDDALSVAPDTGSTLEGGPGTDTILGSDLSDFITGDGGDDRIDARAGDDTINGDGPHAKAGTDEIDAGAGRDSVTYGGHHQPVTIDLRGTTGYGHAGEDDTVRNAEDAYGGRAGDRIYGDGGPNRLHGGGGPDVIRAGGGDDSIWVNQRRRPHRAVELHCGRGRDVVANVSRETLVPSSCERARKRRFTISTRLRRDGAGALIARVRQRPQLRRYRRAHCRVVLELAGPQPADATERPPTMGSAAARTPVDRWVDVRVALNDYGRRLLARPGRTRVLVSIDGADTCSGATARPPRGFTLLL